MESSEHPPEIDDEAAEELEQERGRLEREGEHGSESSEQSEELEDRGDV
jgi:hypothetical protein